MSDGCLFVGEGRERGEWRERGGGGVGSETSNQICGCCVARFAQNHVCGDGCGGHPRALQAR